MMMKIELSKIKMNYSLKEDSNNYHIRFCWLPYYSPIKKSCAGYTFSPIIVAVGLPNLRLYEQGGIDPIKTNFD
jgi:hypothetical protein